jgi:catechol 2,3-dioxygenase-like lactoylglutathione lyase family enzyme
MGLSSYKVQPTIAVSDMGTATQFYEGTLGLSGGEDQDDGGRQYPCADGTTIHIYPSAANAGKGTATVAAWEVDDVETVVDDLTAKGVTFEQYDDPEFKTDAKGIVTMGALKGAWFKDPDGNTMAIAQEG